MTRAADLLRLAREERGLTQSTLARLSGVPQSVISEYETGRREPSFGAVDRLITAAGLVLEVSPRPTTPSTLDRLQAASDELHRALSPLGATRIRVFGSVARGDDTPHSDVDLVVDVRPETGLFALLEMQREAEAVLGRRVDLVPSDGLKPAVADDLERDAVVL